MILISNDFWHKRNNYNFDPYNVLLAIAINIAVLLMTALCSRDTNLTDPKLFKWNCIFVTFVSVCKVVSFLVLE